jgi:hypothetical protein
VKILSPYKFYEMKYLLALIALFAVVFFMSCKKDDFKEVVGVCPLVVSTTPSANATGVPLAQILSARFNTRIDSSTVTAASFLLRGNGMVAGIVTVSDSVAYFRPSGALVPNTTYTATITTLVKDVTGNALQTDYVWSFVTGAALVEFQSMSRFGVFASDAINNVGFSQIRDMDVGISDAFRSNITGFPPGEVFNGGIYAFNDVFPAGVPAMLAQAKVDLIGAYSFAELAMSPSVVAITGDQGGRTLTPGIYKSTGAFLLQSGNLVLNARGDANAVWIFQIGGNLTSVGGSGGNIVLTGGAQAKNVFWQVGNSASLGSNTVFHGNVLALNAISLNSNVDVTGRLLSRNGTVSLSTSIVKQP